MTNTTKKIKRKIKREMNYSKVPSDVEVLETCVDGFVGILGITGSC